MSLSAGMQENTFAAGVQKPSSVSVSAGVQEEETFAAGVQELLLWFAGVRTI